MTKRLTNEQIKKIEEMPVLILQGELLGLIDEVKEKRKIEEELGIDLAILVKARDGVYFKVNNNIAFDRGFIDIHAKEIRVNTYYSYPDFPNGNYKLKFEDYGKTRSLRKEDLE